MQPARQIAAQAGRSAVSAEIRALMGRHRVTQTALADYLGMSQSALSERLNGRVPWDVDDLNGVAERFGIEVADLFTPPSAHNPRYVNVRPVVTYLGDMQLFDPDVPFTESFIHQPLELVKA